MQPVRTSTVRERSASALHPEATVSGVRWPPDSTAHWHCVAPLRTQARRDSSPCAGFRLLMLRVCSWLYCPWPARPHLKAVTAQGPAVKVSRMHHCPQDEEETSQRSTEGLAGAPGLAARAPSLGLCTSWRHLSPSGKLPPLTPCPFLCPTSCDLMTSASYFQHLNKQLTPSDQVTCRVFSHYCFYNIIRL